MRGARTRRRPAGPAPEALGRLVVTCGGVETWLAVIASEVSGMKYVKVERWQTTQRIEAARKAGDDRLDAILDRSSRLFKTRNMLIHGIGIPAADTGRMKHQLLDRGTGEVKTSKWLGREDLIELVNEAWSIGDDLQDWLTDRVNE